ncbi:MAG: hypothetical protein E7Z98_04950 [Olsenella sp.]|nr:hypothetical protein [Olsenella sp.]
MKMTRTWRAHSSDSTKMTIAGTMSQGMNETASGMMGPALRSSGSRRAAHRAAMTRAASHRKTERQPCRGARMTLTFSRTTTRGRCGAGACAREEAGVTGRRLTWVRSAAAR